FPRRCHFHHPPRIRRATRQHSVGCDFAGERGTPIVFGVGSHSFNLMISRTFTKRIVTSVDAGTGPLVLPRSVSRHRFSDAARSSKSEAPSGGWTSNWV